MEQLEIYQMISSMKQEETETFKKFTKLEFFHVNKAPNYSSKNNFYHFYRFLRKIKLSLQ